MRGRKRRVRSSTNATAAGVSTRSAPSTWGNDMELHYPRSAAAAHAQIDRFGNPSGTGRMEPPLEMIALDDDAPGDLTVGAALDSGRLSISTAPFFTV